MKTFKSTPVLGAEGLLKTMRKRTPLSTWIVLHGFNGSNPSVRIAGELRFLLIWRFQHRLKAPYQAKDLERRAALLPLRFSADQAEMTADPVQSAPAQPGIPARRLLSMYWKYGLFLSMAMPVPSFWAVWRLFPPNH